MNIDLCYNLTRLFLTLHVYIRFVKRGGLGMYVTLEELSTNPRKQVRARLVRSCTVVLTSGMEIEFDRLLRSYTYRGDMSEQNKKEFEKVKELLKI